MRSLAWCAALAALPLQLRAQAPDTALYTARVEARFGLVNVATKRAVSVADLGVSYGSASLHGAEFQVASATGGGLRLHYESGTIGGGASVPAAGKLEALEARILLGTHDFALVPGYLLRSTRWNDETRRLNLGQLGMEAGRAFGGAGMQIRIGGGYIRSLSKASSDSMMVSGYEGSTSLLYAPPKYPVYVELGYRRQVLAYKQEKLMARREETSGLILSFGVQTGMPAR